MAAAWEERAHSSLSWTWGVGVVQVGGGGQPPLASPDRSLDRIPLYKFKSIRRTISEVGGPVEDLIAKGPISKYTLGVPAMMTGGPVPEMLKNYMDVSGEGVSSVAGGGGPVGSRHCFRWGMAFKTSCV